MSVELPLSSLGLLVAASFLTSIVSGILGLAGGVALLGVMTVVLPAPAVIPLHGMAQLFSNGSRTALLLKEVVWRYALVYLGPLTVGVLLGAWFGRGLDFRWLEPVIAGMLLVVIGFRRLAPRLRHPPLWSYAAVGLFVGVLTLFVGATGPFMAPLFQRDDLEPKQIVGTMAIAQSWNHLLKAPAFLLLGFNFAPHLPLLGLLFLSSVAGSWVGRRALDRVDKERFGRAVEVVLFALAVFLLVRGLSTLYLVRGKISIDRRSCYLERERGRLWVGGDYDDRRGIYCGGITLEARGKTFADPGGAGSIYRAVNLLPDQLADYGYVANRRADWFPFQAEIVTRADERLITLRFKLKGPDLTARIDQLELRPLLEVAPPLSTTARPRQDELWLERPTVESARLVLGTAKHRWEISQSPPAITVRSLDGRTLGTVRFTTPILRGPAPTPVCTPHPRYASKKQQCQLSWGDLELAAFEDGNLILRTKVPTRFSVRGGGAPQRYAAFDLGTFFEASLDPGAPGGLLFQPEQERFAMSGLESQRVFTHRIPSKIGAAAPDQNGLFTFDSDRFLAIKARPGAYRVVSGPGASGALQVDYESVAGDRFVLTAFPQRYARRLDQQAFWPLVRVPVECDPLDALDAQGQIRSACAAKLDQLQNELGVRSLFFNNRTYARSVNAPVEFLMSRADPRKVIAPAELVPAVALSAVPSCASGVLSTNACRATVNDPFDLGGPWAPPPDREVKLRDFLRALRGRGLLSLAYSSPQFYFYGLDRYLADLRRLRGSEIGFDGVYLDGAPAEGAVVAGLEATRRIREAVGADGRIVFHLSSGTLPEDRAIRPVHLEPYADAIVVGEGSKAAWDLEPGAAPPRDCPPIWGLLYAGRLASGVPYALMPEVRPIDHARAGDFGSSAVPSWTLHPARQVEAQALCGGGIATLGTANRSFSFIDKFSPAARIMLGPGQPEAGECGYWSRLEHGGFCGP